MSNKLVKPHIDTMQMILGFLAVKYLQERGGQAIILSMDEMKALGQFTVRMEVVDPMHPETSPVKCHVITVAEAMKMLEEINKMKGTTVI